MHQIEAQEKNLNHIKSQNYALENEIQKLENINEEIKKEIGQTNQLIQKEKTKEMETQTQIIKQEKAIKLISRNKQYFLFLGKNKKN